MKNSRDGKSYSTNLAFTPPEYLRTGMPYNTFSFLLIWPSCFRLTLYNIQMNICFAFENLQLFMFCRDE